MNKTGFMATIPYTNSTVYNEVIKLFTADNTTKSNVMNDFNHSAHYQYDLVDIKKDKITYLNHPFSCIVIFVHLKPNQSTGI